MAKPRHIVALGGGGFGMEERSPLDAYILGLSAKKRPTICYIGTAKGDSERYLGGFYQAFAKDYPDCHLTHLPVFGQKGDAADIVARSDIFYVGGGSTTSMLVLWRAWGIDLLLRQAYEAGKIIAGMSAGANCWFEHYVDDCSGRMAVYPGLGWLKGGFAPHAESVEDGWELTLQKAIQRGDVKSGLACDNFVGLHFINEGLTKVVASQPKYFARHLVPGKTKVQIKPLKPELLGHD